MLEDFVDELIFQFALQFVGVHQMVELVLVVAVNRVLVLFVGFTHSGFNFGPYAMFDLLLDAESFIVMVFLFELFYQITEMLVFVFDCFQFAGCS